MKIGIMQPYFFPYIGYWQLIDAVDTFILYDNIKYTKRGWINRNRILVNGKPKTFTLPLKGGSDKLEIANREIADSFDWKRMLKQISVAYERSPYFNESFPLIERIVHYSDYNLFSYLYHSILQISEHLGINKKIIISSSIPLDHNLHNTERVLATCEMVGADGYVNAIGGVMLYSKSDFKAKGVGLEFVSSRLSFYPQFGNEFVPWLSIIDVMMFNSIDKIRSYILPDYELV